MTRNHKMLAWVAVTMSCLIPQAIKAADDQCGERVAVDDVLVVNLEDYVDQPALFGEKLYEQAGDYLLITQKPMQVKMKGNRAHAIHNASMSSAHLGCDLLVLLGEKVKQTRWQAKTTSEVLLMVHIGKRKSP